MAESDLMALVRQASLDLPGSRKSIAEFLQREGSGVANLSMAEVAEVTFTSKPSLVRFAKGMGFVGWRDFRMAFVSQILESEAQADLPMDLDPNHPFDAHDDISEVVRNVSVLEQQAIAEAMAQVDEQALAEATHRVLQARCLVFFGAEPNDYFGKLFAYKLKQIGVTCHVPEAEEWAMVARGLEPHDCAIIVSYSGVGQQRPPVSLASMFNEVGVPMVAITNSGSNWLREQCDCVLSFRPREHYYSKISGYYSERCISFMLDALFSACFSANYESNEVAKLRTLLAYERQLHQHLHVDDVLPC